MRFRFTGLNQVIVLIHPIIKHAEFFNDLCFYFVYRHVDYSSSVPVFQCFNVSMFQVLVFAVIYTLCLCNQNFANILLAYSMIHLLIAKLYISLKMGACKYC